MKLGINQDWGIGPQIATFEDYQRMRRAGITHLRYTLYWNRVNPRPGVYDFRQVDKELSLALDSGFEIYINICWIPYWVTDGHPAYEPFDAGCSTVIREDDGIGLVFDTSKKWCVKPPRISTGSIYGITRRVLERYQNRGIKYYGIGNEIEYSYFFPPAYSGENKHRRYINELLKPFVDAVRTYQLGRAYIVGPETNEISALKVILEAEAKENGWFDVISNHGYAPNFPFGGAEKIEELIKVVAPFRRQRPLWITEVSTTSPTKPDYVGLQEQKIETMQYLTLAKKYSELDSLFLYRLRRDTDGADHGLILKNGDSTPLLQEMIGQNVRN